MMVRPIGLLCVGALALGLSACKQDTAPQASGVDKLASGLDKPASGLDKPASKGSAVGTSSARKTPTTQASRKTAPFNAHFSAAQVVRIAPVKGKWTASWQTPKKAEVLDLATICAKDLFFDGAVKPLVPVGMFHNPKLQRQELVFSVMSNSYETGHGEKRTAIIYVSKDGVLRCRHADNYAFKRQRQSCLKMTCAKLTKGITR